MLMEDGGEPVDLAGRMLAGLDRAVVLNGRVLPVGASIGIARCDLTTCRRPRWTCSSGPTWRCTPPRRAGKSGVQVYSADLDRAQGGSLDLRAAFAADLHAGLIDVAFQPIRLANGRLGGFEALARWTHEGTPIPPATFLPMARRLGCLPALDRVVLAKAVDQAASWGGDVVLAVNLDADTLADETSPTTRSICWRDGSPLADSPSRCSRAAWSRTTTAHSAPSAGCAPPVCASRWTTSARATRHWCDCRRCARHRQDRPQSGRGADVGHADAAADRRRAARPPDRRDRGRRRRRDRRAACGGDRGGL